jgi:vitellogenic carboxypeptidase-like protein
VRRGDRQYERHEMYTFLRDPKIKYALNVPATVEYVKDDRVFEHLAGDVMKSSAGYFAPLLDNGYKVLLYQGQYDLRDGVLSATQWIGDVAWKHRDEYADAKRDVWRTERNGGRHVAGYVTASHNLVRVELLNAGHLAPGDQGYNSAEMIRLYLLN